MRKGPDGPVYRVTFDSLNDLVDTAEPHIGGYRDRTDWRGATPTQAAKLGREGWDAQLSRALDVAESAVDKVEREHEVTSFSATHDVAGCEVDVARYLDGTPENMIDYPLTPIVKAGRVITLCASTVYSASLSQDTIIRRGQVITAFALALSRLGYSLEIWGDYTAGKHGTEKRVQMRTLIKGATDVLDPARILYALAHPSMLRVLQFGIMEGELGEGLLRRYGVGHGLGPIQPILRDLPEGTVYVGSVVSNRDVPDADVQLVEWLTELGIITD
jgi:hypothetical protein